LATDRSASVAASTESPAPHWNIPRLWRRLPRGGRKRAPLTRSPGLASLKFPAGLVRPSWVVQPAFPAIKCCIARYLCTLRKGRADCCRLLLCTAQ